MTKKDYIKLASVINVNRGDGLTADEKVKRIAQDIADVCAADNPRFDRRRFLKACGLLEG